MGYYEGKNGGKWKASRIKPIDLNYQFSATELRLLDNYQHAILYMY